MLNTVSSIGKHLSVCENFKTTYPDRVEYVKKKYRDKKTENSQTENS